MKPYRTPQKPEYLYYGSSECFDVIPPSQAYDLGQKKGTRNVVYATSIRDIALAYALGVVPDENGQHDRVRSYKYGIEVKMIFHKGHPNFGGKGYVYRFSSKGFIHAGGTQWVSPSPVTPLEVTEINVDDYLYLFRYATEEEKRQIVENFSERQ
jgi:hypothetical protein